MKNVLLTTLFTGLLSANVAMANTQVAPQDIAPKANIEMQQIQDATPALKKTSEKNDEISQSKLVGGTIYLAQVEKVENCWAWDACMNSKESGLDGYDSYAFN